MKIELTIQGQRVTCDLSIGKLTGEELGSVERYTGMTATEWGRRLMNTRDISALAWYALAWLMVRRAGSFDTFDVFLERTSLDTLKEIIQSARVVPDTPEPAAQSEPAAVSAPMSAPAVNPLGVPLNPQA